jgi:transcriptional regulator with XRE-family HTH domain
LDLAKYDAELRKDVSDFLKSLRATRNKMPLKELGGILGVSPSLLSNYEQGIQPLSVAAVNHLSVIATKIELSHDEAERLFTLLMRYSGPKNLHSQYARVR